MSRSWFFFGLVAFTTAVGFAGCTITTDTDGGVGGADGNGGDASGGSAGEGGNDQGGTTSQGGAGGQGGDAQGGAGGQSSTVTMEEAVAKLCAIEGIATCIGSATPCDEYYTAEDSQFPNCLAKHTALIDCLSNLSASAFTCAGKTADGGTPDYSASDSCTTEDTTYLDCTAQ